jgi:eukaryotic-like serine/threonine-protein kinase
MQPDAAPQSQAKTARELFDAAMQIPTADRTAWLAGQSVDEAMRQRVTALIKAEANTDNLLDRPFIEQLAGLAAPLSAGDNAALSSSVPGLDPALALVGTHIQGYRLMSMLGQGGMASVFEAERSGADFEQRVAVKLLRRNLHSDLELKLFQRERQALASLEHPNITRLLDGGVTSSGVPYLVMELVQGVDLLSFARQNKLSLRARLALFTQVCDAVNAAHRALIVHRDIKPANIWVNEAGQVKLLDFGIAKLLDESASQQDATFAPLTPEYAAPEQFDGGNITTATDVFGLGVVLHELLLGARPRRGNTLRASDLLGDERTTQLPATPITRAELKRFLRGDIDNILRQSLNAEPKERYASAGDLAADLRRFLDGQPVQAHPPSGWYRTHKFIRRNLAAVAVCSLLLLGLLCSLVYALNQAQLAKAQAERAGATRDFLVQMFRAAEPQTEASAKLSVIDFVKQTTLQLPFEQNLPTDVKAELASVLGSVLVRQGDAKAGLALLEAGLAQATRGDFSAPLKFQLAENYIASLVSSGRPEQGLKALAHYESLRPTLTQANQATFAALRAQAFSKLDDDAAASGAAALAMSLCQPMRVCDEPTQMQVLETSAIVHQTFFRYLEAAQNYQQLRVLAARRYGATSVPFASAINGLAGAYRGLERFDEAAKLMQQVMEIDTKTLPALHVRRAVHMNFLGLLQTDMRDYRAAAKTLSQTLAISEKLGVSDIDIALDEHNLAMIYARLGQFELAEAGLSRALAQYEKLYGARDIRTTMPRSNLSHVLALQGNFSAAASLMQTAIADMRASDKPNPMQLQQNLLKWAQQQFWVGNTSAAENAIVEGEQILGSLGVNAPSSAIRQFKLMRALILFEAKQFPAAENLIAELAPSFAKEKFASNAEIEYTLLQGQLALQRGDKPRAAAALQHADQRIKEMDAVYGYVQRRRDLLAEQLVN